MGSVDAPIIFRVVPELELVVLRAAVFHPVKQYLKPLSLWVILRKHIVLLYFILHFFQNLLEGLVVWVYLYPLLDCL